MPGFIALMGGNEFNSNCAQMDRTLFKLIRPHARVAILPTAAAYQNPGRAIDTGSQYLSSLGLQPRGVLITTRDRANDAEWVGPLNSFQAVYITGGDPIYLLETLRGSLLWQALVEMVEQGGLLIGASAGAMIMGEQMWGFGDGWLEGLKLVPGVAVIPHHASLAGRWGVDRIQRDLASHVCLLGIDEATTVYHSSDSDQWAIAGQGEAVVYSVDSVTRYHFPETFQLA